MTSLRRAQMMSTADFLHSQQQELLRQQQQGQEQEHQEQQKSMRKHLHHPNTATTTNTSKNGSNEKNSNKNKNNKSHSSNYNNTATTTSSVIDSHSQCSSWLHRINACPIFYATPEDMHDPISYIRRIQPEAMQYGICIIRVPDAMAVPAHVALTIGQMNTAREEEENQEEDNENKNNNIDLHDLNQEAGHARNNMGSNSIDGNENNKKEMFHEMQIQKEDFKFQTRVQVHKKKKNNVSKNGDITIHKNGIGDGDGDDTQANDDLVQHKLVKNKKSGGYSKIIESKKKYTIAAYEKFANNFLIKKYGSCACMPAHFMEREYWRHVNSDAGVTVEYGNDIEGSAFTKMKVNITYICTL